MSNGTVITTAPGTPFIDIEREFDATPEQLFRAASEPELVKQWLGRGAYEMSIDTYDVRPGGRYRYVQKTPEGDEYGFRGRSVFPSVESRDMALKTGMMSGVEEQMERLQKVVSAN